MNAHRIGSDTTVMAAIEIAKAAKLYVMFKTFCVVCVKSAANPSTIQANIKAKAIKKNRAIEQRADRVHIKWMESYKRRPLVQRRA